MNKRSFFKKIAVTGMGMPLAGNALANWIQNMHHLPAEQLADDESFWAGIRGGYKLKPEYINLENGYYNILPEALLENYIRQIREVNYQGAYYMRTVQFDNKKAMAAKLAAMAGCSPEELIITRNTTESLDMVIGGLHWKAGDEAVMAQQDYGSMLEMFKQVAARYGVVNNIVSIPNHPVSDEEIVQLYAAQLNSNTRLLMIPHMVNITGHVLPVRKICDMAHDKGVDVMVDGAHAIAHLEFKIADLHCDYYGASLHKWLSVPLGSGMLYVKKGKAANVWPLLAEGGKEVADIARLNHVGTHPAATDLSIAAAVDYYNMIGPARKEARLRYLQQYWTSKVRTLPNVIVNTPEDSARCCGIANAGIKGMKPSDLADILLKKYKIYTVAIDYANVQGCRITPNTFTTPAELDVLVKALTELK